METGPGAISAFFFKEIPHLTNLSLSFIFLITVEKQFGFIGNFILIFVKSAKKTIPQKACKNRDRLEFNLMYAAVILFAFSKKIWMIPYCFDRTPKEQYGKYLAGQSNIDGYITRGPHQDWKASDLLELNGNLKPIWTIITSYKILGIFWEAMSGIWGYRWWEKGKTDFKDIYHYQLKSR